MGAKVFMLGLLKEHQPESDANGAWIVPAGTTVQEIVEKTGGQQGKWEFVITVNGQSVLRSHELADGDEVVFTTLFLGG